MENNNKNSNHLITEQESIIEEKTELILSQLRGISFRGIERILEKVIIAAKRKAVIPQEE